MRNFITLLIHELKIQNRIHSIIRYNLQFLLLGSTAIIFVHGASTGLAELGIIFTVIALPLSIISTSRGIIKADITDGYMELLMITTSPIKIILIKYLGLLIHNLVALAIAMPLVAIFYSISSWQIFLISIGGSLLLGQITALSLLTSCIEGYFRTNTNIISLVILPLIIPGLIACGLLISGGEQWSVFVGLLGGVDLVIIPLTLLLSEYLMRNIYNT